MTPAGSSSWPSNADSLTGAKKGGNPNSNMALGDKQLIEVFAQKLAGRGARGIVGLQRQFKIFDDDRSKDLNQYEFTKAIKDFRIPIMEKDIDRLFNLFDRDRSGAMNYDEFLRGVRVSSNY